VTAVIARDWKTETSIATKAQWAFALKPQSRLKGSLPALPGKKSLGETTGGFGMNSKTELNTER